MVNPAMLFKLKGAWDTFSKNHPKFPKFLQAVSGNGTIQDGTVIEITITKVDGEKVTTNLKLNQEDMELFDEVSKLIKK